MPYPFILGGIAAASLLLDQYNKQQAMAQAKQDMLMERGREQAMRASMLNDPYNMPVSPDPMSPYAMGIYDTPPLGAQTTGGAGKGTGV